MRTEDTQLASFSVYFFFTALSCESPRGSPVRYVDYLKRFNHPIPTKCVHRFLGRMLPHHRRDFGDLTAAKGLGHCAH